MVSQNKRCGVKELKVQGLNKDLKKTHKKPIRVVRQIPVHPSAPFPQLQCKIIRYYTYLQLGRKMSHSMFYSTCMYWWRRLLQQRLKCRHQKDV
jgi:hypothetical protein